MTQLPDLRHYRLVVFDLDGTLYRQGPVRRAMLRALLRHGGPPGRFRRMAILRRFRILREEVAATCPGDFDGPLYTEMEALTGLTEADLRALVTEWMEMRPLTHLAPARVRGAADLFRLLREHGSTIAVWSDYPVKKKLQALDLRADHLLWPGAPGVKALKPDPSGLCRAMELAGAGREETLMVGDRRERDGAAAAAAGVDFLWLHSGRRRHDETFSGRPRIADFRPLVTALETRMERI